MRTKTAMSGNAAMTAMQVETDDGTTLHVLRAGKGPRVVLFVAGLLGHVDVWAPLCAALSDDALVLCWDLRGSRRRHGVPEVDLARHAADGIAILDAVGADRATIVGWSTGAPVAAQILALAPTRVAAFVSIAGVWGGPVGRMIRRWLSGAADAGPVALGIGAMVGRGVALPRWIAESARSRIVLSGLVLTGLVGEHADDAAIGEVLAHFASLEASFAAASWSALLDHLGDAQRPEVDVPSLWITGERDPLAGPMVTRLAAAGASDGEVWTIPGGGHFLPLEQPELLALRMRRLFRGLDDAPLSGLDRPEP